MLSNLLYNGLIRETCPLGDECVPCTFGHEDDCYGPKDRLLNSGNDHYPRFTQDFV
jgi:hypothetical protein